MRKGRSVRDCRRPERSIWNGLDKSFRRRSWSARDAGRRLDSEDFNPDDILVASGNGRIGIVMVVAIVRLEMPMSESFRMVIVGLVDVLRRSERREHKARGNEETPETPETPGRLPETDHEG